MQFSYQCDKCGKFDLEFPVGKAPRTSKCPSCGRKSSRVYEGTSLSIRVNGSFGRTSKFGEQMRQKNMKAGQRMKGREPGLRLAAYDYGGGDVREVKKGKR